MIFHCQIVIVFPTPVGVFLDVQGGVGGATSLPHARGGVSKGLIMDAIKLSSSPRPWGCFYRVTGTGSHFFVFPTPVGVFLVI